MKEKRKQDESAAHAIRLLTEEKAVLLQERARLKTDVKHAEAASVHWEKACLRLEAENKVLRSKLEHSVEQIAMQAISKLAARLHHRD